MKFPAFAGVHISQAPHLMSVSSALGSYPLALATRRNWTSHSQTILQTRSSAPCGIRLGTTIANRHPPN